MEQFEGLYISSGEGNQMFTLRSSEKQYGRNQNCWFRDTHIRNLSTDLEQAKQKAREYAGYDVPVMVSDNLEDINRRDKKRKGADIVRTGFLAGKSIYDLSDWELSQNIYNIQKAPKKFQELYFEEMELRQLYYGGQRRVLTQGKEVLKKLKNLKRREEYQKELEEKQAKQNFVGQIGERMTFDLVLEFETSGASQWGNWYLYNFVDENGNKFVYMGSTIIYVYKGDKVRLTGTIKSHDLYRGEKQTKLERIKVQQVLEKAE